MSIFRFLTFHMIPCKSIILTLCDSFQAIRHLLILIHWHLLYFSKMARSCSKASSVAVSVLLEELGDDVEAAAHVLTLFAIWSGSSSTFSDIFTSFFSPSCWSVSNCKVAFSCFVDVGLTDAKSSSVWSKTGDCGPASSHVDLGDCKYGRLAAQ